jgi:hypothetical protein
VRFSGLLECITSTRSEPPAAICSYSIFMDDTRNIRLRHLQGQLGDIAFQLTVAMKVLHPAFENEPAANPIKMEPNAS